MDRITLFIKHFIKYFALIYHIECRKSVSGREYTGTTSVTKSGLECQPWSRQLPHQHNFGQPDSFSDASLGDASNYCRNPDTSETGGVWCYTADPAIRWEYCDVPLCPDVTLPTSDVTKPPPTVPAAASTIQSNGGSGGQGNTDSGIGEKSTKAPNPGRGNCIVFS